MGVGVERAVERCTRARWEQESAARGGEAEVAVWVRGSSSNLAGDRVSCRVGERGGAVETAPPWAFH